MGRARKARTKKVDTHQINEVLVLHQQLQQQKLLKLNRFLVYGIFVLMFSVIVLGFFLIPNTHDKVLQSSERQRTQVQQELKNPVLNAEIEHLKGQLVSVVSGSIEGKLKSLEENIKLGSVLSSLETVRELREDVKALRNYSYPEKDKLQKTVAVNQVLIKEVSQLRNLIYFTLGSCSLMFAAFTTIWFKNRKRLHYQPNYIDIEAEKN